MAPDDVRHVEAVALIRHLLEKPGAADRSAVEAWLEENHPPPAAYLAALRSFIAHPSQEKTP